MAAFDADAAAGFDPSAYAAGTIKRRGERICTFMGLPCYECEWLLNGKMTYVMRIVFANGFGYQLMLLGNADPVEQRPDFEAIMNGFDFTSPPVPPDPLERGKRVARLVGKLSASCVFGALVLGFLVRSVRRK